MREIVFDGAELRTPREIQDELFRILTEYQRRQERWRTMDMER